MSNGYDRDDEIRVCPFCNQEIAQRPQTQPGRTPFGPQFGPPFGPPSQPPFQPQQPGRNQDGPPMGPPPSFVPQQQTQRGGPGGSGGSGVRFIDPGAIRPCTYRFVYLWLDNGRSYWAWLVFVGPRSVAGWRWNGRRWVYFGIDLDRIESFICQ